MGIAREMGLNQSTISRDLQYIKGEARKQIEKYLKEEILFEYVRYVAGSDEITKKSWETVENKDTTPKEKTNALSLLVESNDMRFERFIGGPQLYMNIRNAQSDINFQDILDKNPVLSASVDIERFVPKSYFSNFFPDVK